MSRADESSRESSGESSGDQRPLASLWTPRGRGAVATIRLRIDVRVGPLADAIPFRAANGKPLSAQLTGRVIFGKWGAEPAEDVVVCVIDDRTVEIHCHGGEAASARVLEDCATAGCRVAPWQEMVRVTQGGLEAELLEALAQATTTRTAEILLEQSNGVLRAEVESLKLESDSGSLKSRIAALLRWADFGMHLMRPWKVVLAGRPNVGKSSLTNALLGYTRSIVFDQPGTTRDVVTGTTAIDGWPIEFSDTAGLRESAEPLETEGIQRARAALEEADLSILLIDFSAPSTEDDRHLLTVHTEALVVAHKCDLPPWNGPNSWDAQLANGWLRVSSKTCEGVEALIREISRRLVAEVPSAATPLPVTLRQDLLLRRAEDEINRDNLSGCRAALAAILR